LRNMGAPQAVPLGHFWCRLHGCAHTLVASVRPTQSPELHSALVAHAAPSAPGLAPASGSNTGNTGLAGSPASTGWNSAKSITW